MPTLNDLKDATDDFFAKHWDKSSTSSVPAWSVAWNYFDELPNNQMGGCYAFTKDDEVKYIGVALNSGAAGYKYHSLGTRITKYWRVNKDVPKRDDKTTYMPSAKLQKEGITAIYTLGIGKEQNYLAIALELFLIKKLKPVMNKIHNAPTIETSL